MNILNCTIKEQKYKRLRERTIRSLVQICTFLQLCINVFYCCALFRGEISGAVGGGVIFIYSCSARLISFEISCL